MGASGFCYLLNGYDAFGKRGPGQFCKQFHFIPRNNVVFASFRAAAVSEKELITGLGKYVRFILKDI